MKNVITFLICVFISFNLSGQIEKSEDYKFFNKKSHLFEKSKTQERRSNAERMIPQSKNISLKSSDSNKQRLDSVIGLTLNVSTNQFENHGKEEFTYDTNGNDTLSIWYNWDNETNNWIGFYKFESTYDTIGNQTSRSRYNWDNETNDWIGDYKYEDTYDTQGNQTIRSRYNWANETNDWIGDYKYTYDYLFENNELIIPKYIYYPNEDTIYYLVNKQIDQINYFDQNETTDIWENTSRYLFYYSGQTFTGTTPTDITLSNSDINENELIGTEVGVLTSTDEDTGDSFTYTLVSGTGDTNNSSFTISGDKLLTNEVFDFETKSSYSIRIQTEDGGENTFSKLLTINVIDVNDPTTDILLSNTTIDENSIIGTVIGIVTLVDEDSFEPYYFSLSPYKSAARGPFGIIGDTLFWNELFLPDFELLNVYDITIYAKTIIGSSVFFSKSFTITINNVNEPPTEIKLSNYEVDENSPIGTVVGILSSTDEDTNDTYTYSLVSGSGDTDNSNFTISRDTLFSNKVFGFETQKLDSIRVQTEDSGGITFSKTLVIGIIDVNEPPTDITLSNSSIDENSPIGTVVGILSSTDEDSGDSFTYSLVSGTGDTNNSSFTISGDELLTNEVFDHETKNSYSVRIQTEDGGGNIFSKLFPISVNNVNDLGIENIRIKEPTCVDSPTGSISFDVIEFIPPLKYSWNTGDTSPTLTNISSGRYSVFITDGDTMTLLQEFNVLLNSICEGVDICYVTSDGESNVIYVNKGLNNYNVEKYVMYREGVSQNDYEKIDEINSTETYFTDSLINNRTQSFSYKVSMIDTFGNESRLSSKHNTIHLSQNHGTSGEVNLYWTHYVGLNIPSYSISRQKGKDEFELLKKISSNNNTYTDFTSNPSFNYQYYISFELENTCNNATTTTTTTTTTTKSAEIIEVKSNTVSTDTTYTGIQDFIDSDYKIYPNPVNDKLTIETNSSHPLELRLFDVNGTQVINLKEVYNKSKINLQGISSGIYFVKLLEDNTVVHQNKIVKY